MRDLLVQALPILIAQLASMGMMVVDTLVLGHVSAADLAAVAIGGGLHVSLVFALVGILQAVAPVVAHLHGAGRDNEVAGVLQQGFWLAMLLSLPGAGLLSAPWAVLSLAEMDGLIEAKVVDYLGILAWGLPAALFYRTFYAFCNALGQPRVLMVIGLIALLLHAFLAWGFAILGWLNAPLGVAGCALSNVMVAWSACLAAVTYLAWGPLGQRYRPFSNWQMPKWPMWRELLRLGVPMGCSNFVEITSFTLISLFIASLGADVVAGHRIVSNLAALCYMLPLSLAIASLSSVAQAVGARDWARANLAIRAGMLLSILMSTVIGIMLWLAARPLVEAYTDDAKVSAVALGLVGFVAVYQLFDALQTMAGHVLRAYRVTFLPMLIQVISFWGVGLLGGWWLCFHAWLPFGVAGFWWASVLSLVFAAGLLGPLLWRTIRITESIL
ncbi:MAG: MATE family efflux transporter [Rhodocyclales bacterium GT-UBC]|nr:MAG: MATE family efflux transporter [Rhodocyclales bacterium GT-UBC]